jgi:hypothetical protein
MFRNQLLIFKVHFYGLKVHFYESKLHFYRLKVRFYGLKVQFYSFKVHFFASKVNFYRLKVLFYELIVHLGSKSNRTIFANGWNITNNSVQPLLNCDNSSRFHLCFFEMLKLHLILYFLGIDG